MGSAFNGAHIMANTSNTFRDDPLRTEQRAGEYGVHPRHTGGHRPKWLVPLLAALALLALAYWALSRRDRVEPSAPSIAPQTEPYQNQMPEPQRQPEPGRQAEPPP